MNENTKEIAPGIGLTPIDPSGGTSILVHCGGWAARKLRCREHIALPIPFTPNELVDMLFAVDWIPAGAKGVNATTSHVLDALCPACAKEILGETLVAHARAMRPKKGTG
jgi:hypothetical protein